MKSFQFAAVFLCVGVIGWISASPAPPASGGYSAGSGSNVAASGGSVGSSGSLGSGVQEIEAEAPLGGAQAAVYDLTRQRKSVSPYGGSGASYGGGASIPAPPCPKNYLFSCQPNLSPVACAAPAAGGYGSVGAYSAPVPTYVAPLNGGYGGLQHQYGSGGYVAPQGYGYGHQNHLYQF